MNNQQILLIVSAVVMVVVLIYMYRQNDFLPKKKVSCINPDQTQMKHIKNYLEILTITYGTLSSNFIRCAQINDLHSDMWYKNPFFNAIRKITGAMYVMSEASNLNDMYSQLPELIDAIKTLKIDLMGPVMQELFFGSQNYAFEIEVLVMNRDNIATNVTNMFSC
jgi:hypothetical protein